MITNDVPYALKHRCWTMSGQLMVTLVVKVSLRLENAMMQFIEPDPIIDRDRFATDDPFADLTDASELAPFLLACDVLLRGSPAHARVDLTVGRGEESILERSVALESEGDMATLFGPVSPRRAARVHHLRGADEAALSLPVPEIAATVSWEYFQAAPSAHRITPLHGDEWIRLSGLRHPAPFVLARLPGRVPKVFARFRSAMPVEVLMLGDRLAIDTDRGVCSVLWRGVFSLPGTAESPASFDIDCRFGPKSAPPPSVGAELSTAPPETLRIAPLSTKVMSAIQHDCAMMARSIPFSGVGAGWSRPPTAEATLDLDELARTLKAGGATAEYIDRVVELVQKASP